MRKMYALIVAGILLMSSATAVFALKPPKTDLCSNLDGFQRTMPAGWANLEYVIALGEWVVLDYCYPLS